MARVDFNYPAGRLTNGHRYRTNSHTVADLIPTSPHTLYNGWRPWLVIKINNLYGSRTLQVRDCITILISRNQLDVG